MQIWGGDVKIKVTEERECCQMKDLRPVFGCAKVGGVEPLLKFCIHCGHYHKHTSFMDPAGSRDYEYRPVKVAVESSD